MHANMDEQGNKSRTRTKSISNAKIQNATETFQTYKMRTTIGLQAKAGHKATLLELCCN
jgi:hypothetical protein